MAQFDEAYKLTGHNEGGYANNPNDHGGETYAGIARKFWPNWSGWKIIDQIKLTFGTSAGEINKAASGNLQLQQSIASFYKQNFWDANSLDLINDQQLADNVYDFGVNSRVGHAAKALQQATGVIQDGIIGSGTIKAVNSLDALGTFNKYNAERLAFYHALATSPGQLQFLSSWVGRIKSYKIT